MKIGYFADGLWSHLALKKLISDERFKICFIVPRYDTQDPILREWAKELAIDFLPIKNVNSKDSIETFKMYRADLFISMSFDQILKNKILQVAPLGFINCHAGNLPFYRGRNILNWALINDEKEYGVSVHYVDEGIDTGDIIEQSVESINDQDNYASLLNRATRLCAEVLFNAVLKIEIGAVTRVKQIEKHSVGFYCSYRRDGDEWIDWSWSSRRIFNFVRAISKPAPCARAIYNGQEVMIECSEMIKSAPNYIDIPGTIVGKDGNDLVVKSGDSTIKLTKISFIETQKYKINFMIGHRFICNKDFQISELINRISCLEDKCRKTDSNDIGDLN